MGSEKYTIQWKLSMIASVVLTLVFIYFALQLRDCSAMVNAKVQECYDVCWCPGEFSGVPNTTTNIPLPSGGDA